MFLFIVSVTRSNVLFLLCGLFIAFIVRHAGLRNDNRALMMANFGVITFIMKYGVCLFGQMILNDPLSFKIDLIFQLKVKARRLAKTSHVFGSPVFFVYQQIYLALLKNDFSTDSLLILPLHAVKNASPGVYLLKCIDKIKINKTTMTQTGFLKNSS